MVVLGGVAFSYERGTPAGYMVYTAATFKYVFDYKPEDVYWCTPTPNRARI